MTASHGLTGKHVLVTRAAEYAPALAELIRVRGATAEILPCLAVEYLPDAIDRGLHALPAHQDVLFTSANGVIAVASVLEHQSHRLLDVLQHKRISAVGAKTAQALRQYGVDVDIVPEIASQDGLIDAYCARGWPESLLFFRAQEGREVLLDALRQQGVRVELVPAYRTVCPDGDASNIIALVQDNGLDAVLLGSAKTARFFIQRLGSVALANRPVIAVISEKLAVAARQLGLDVQVVAETASFESMLDGLSEYFDHQS